VAENLSQGDCNFDDKSHAGTRAGVEIKYHQIGVLDVIDC
jgi:hypothetical protein